MLHIKNGFGLGQNSQRSIYCKFIVRRWCQPQTNFIRCDATSPTLRSCFAMLLICRDTFFTMLCSSDPYNWPWTARMERGAYLMQNTWACENMKWPRHCLRTASIPFQEGQSEAIWVSLLEYLTMVLRCFEIVHKPCHPCSQKLKKVDFWGGCHIYIYIYI